MREDSRASEVLYVLPTADYQAYNTWGCKSLYYDACGGANTASGDGRAVAVSFDRPQAESNKELNHFFGPDYSTVFWLEQQGYDVSYTDDIQTDSNLPALLNHKIDLVSGHSEYWSYNSFNNFKKARDAGVNVISLSANTAYWQTRYEDNHRTLVCYKTIQGSSDGNPGGTPNDPAATGPKGEILPQFATTTRRDPGAPAGDPNAPPGGRIGPNEPENSLWGVMYVGDNDALSYNLTIPAGNANGEYASGRFWRNTHISTSQSTTLPAAVVGWEWDQVPTQPGYLAQEPAGVKQLTLTNVANGEDSWLQDAGRARSNTPPPGEPSTVNAVEYRAPSGALVFSSGTMEWAFGFDSESTSVIDQATYNVISEMGVQPATPASDITLDSPTEAKPPRPSFTATPSSTTINTPVAFDASASTDPDAVITDYKWDLDNSGTFATDTGATPKLTHAFTAPGTYKVILKTTDSKGAVETTSRTVNVANTVNAALTASMNPVGVSQPDTLSAAGSTDTGGTITDYKWDLNGDGTYETDTGTTPTVKTTFTTSGTKTVGVQVSDNNGGKSTATLGVRVITQGVSRYADAVTSTPGLLHYYKLDELTGTTIADSAGHANGLLSEAVMGRPGAINGDPGKSIGFTGSGDPVEGQTGSDGEISMDLSGRTAITVEFWLKWDAYGNNDALAMEFTPNYNEHAGGFIVDPNATEFGGTFGIGIGAGGTRNSVFFQRPSAGVWHHYAIVMNSAAPAATQITPYVDGAAVSYQKESSNTGAGAVRQLDAVPLLPRRRLAVRLGLARRTRRLRRRTERSDGRRTRQRQRPRGPSCPRRERQPGAAQSRPERDPQRLWIHLRERVDHQVRMGPQRRRQLRDQHGRHADRQHVLRQPRYLHGRTADHRQRRWDGDPDEADRRRTVPAQRGHQGDTEPRAGLGQSQTGRLRIDRPGHHHRLQVGPQRRRHLRDRHRHNFERDDELRRRRPAHRRCSGDRQQRPEQHRTDERDSPRTGRQRL